MSTWNVQRWAIAIATIGGGIAWAVFSGGQAKDFVGKGLLGIAAGVVVICAISLIRAPALVDEELKNELKALKSELLSIQKRERPAIVIRRGWVDQRIFQSSPNNRFFSLNLLVANDSTGISEDSAANSVVAIIQFVGSSGELLCEVDAGRWGDADQPIDPSISSVPLRRVDFLVGETRELNVAAKFVSDGLCYAIDNDYVATGGRKQSLQLSGETVTARIRLRAVGVKLEWTVRFENPANGDLRLLSIQATSSETL